MGLLYQNEGGSILVNLLFSLIISFDSFLYEWRKLGGLSLWGQFDQNWFFCQLGQSVYLLNPFSESSLGYLRIDPMRTSKLKPFLVLFTKNNNQKKYFKVQFKIQQKNMRSTFFLNRSNENDQWPEGNLSILKYSQIYWSKQRTILILLGNKNILISTIEQNIVWVERENKLAQSYRKHP